MLMGAQGSFPDLSNFSRVKTDVRFEDESVWLTQQMMADLFQSSKQNISHHIKNIFEEDELLAEATVKKYLTVQQEGSRQVQRQLEYYNLDMIISVGYQVKSHVATRFRIWATQQLREYIVKGFLLDDERLKNPDQPFDHSPASIIPTCTEKFLSSMGMTLCSVKSAS